MKTSKLMALLLVLALPAIGCKTQEKAEVDDQSDTATATTDQEISGVNKPNDLNPVEAQTMVDDVTIGKKVNADGMIDAADQGDDFAPGQTVYLTMNVSDTPANSAIKVSWYGPGETKISDDQKTVTVGTKYLTFQADTAKWAKGDYRAEVWIGDEKVDTQEFQVVDAENAGK